jgi:hypothetical protein
VVPATRRRHRRRAQAPLLRSSCQSPARRSLIWRPQSHDTPIPKPLTGPSPQADPHPAMTGWRRLAGPGASSMTRCSLSHHGPPRPLLCREHVGFVNDDGSGRPWPSSSSAVQFRPGPTMRTTPRATEAALGVDAYRWVIVTMREEPTRTCRLVDARSVRLDHRTCDAVRQRIRTDQKG